MAEKINLKEIERKIYTSYHQDGLLDVCIALVVLSFGISMVLDMPWLGGTFAVVGITLYTAAKKTLIFPRAGFVKFAQYQYRAKALISITVGVFSFFALLGVVVFMQFEGGGTPIWLLFLIENYMLVIGISVAALFCTLGYTFKIGRMYLYALLTLVMFVTGYFLSYPLHYYLTLLGTVILFFGLAILIRFIRRYPLQNTETIGDSGNEGQ
jgi:hypothetical protein